MKIQKSIKGQTLIETALVLFLLMLIVLGLTEFARAWYTKNSIKNASRHGVRTAVVTDNITAFTETPCPDPCPGTRPADGNPLVVYAACCESPGVKVAFTTITLAWTDDDSSGGLNDGDTVTVTVNFNSPDFFIVGGPPWPWPDELITSSESTMRYE